MVEEQQEEKKQIEPKQEAQKIEKTLKGKQWIKILAPKYFEEKFLGETLVSEPEQVLNRTVETGSFEFNGDPNRFYYKLFFKVSEVDGSIARTKFFGHDCSRDFLARVVHYNSTRIDTNGIISLKDGKLRIKTISVTAKPVSKAVEKELRKKIEEQISFVKDFNVEEFVKKIISGELQENIRAAVNKIYPLRTFEFRKTEVLS